MINDLRDARRLKVCIQTGSDMQRTSTSSAAQESHCLLFFIFPFFQLFFFYILYFVFCKNFSLFLSPFFLFLPFLLSYTLLFSLFLIFSTLVSFMNKYMSEQTNTTSRFPQYLFWHLPLVLFVDGLFTGFCLKFQESRVSEDHQYHKFWEVFFSLSEGRRSCNVWSNVTTLKEKNHD